MNPVSTKPRALQFPQLSDRERDILSLIARGLSNPEIADHYVLSLKPSAPTSPTS